MRGRRAELGAMTGLALVLAFFGWQGLTDAGGGLRAVQDHTITVSLSRELVDTGAYHRDFVYPLPAVALKLALGALGAAGSSLVWMALLLAAGVASAWALGRLIPAGPGRSRLAAPLLGALALVYCLQWDYRAVNGNTIVLAAALGAFVCVDRGRDAAAGALLAASIALKLYTAPLVLLFAWRARWRAVAWTLAFGVLLFVILPAAWLGPAKALAWTGMWIEQVLRTSAPDAAIRVTAYDVSLLRVARAALGDAGDSVGAGPVIAWRGIGIVFALAAAAWIGGRGRTPASDPSSADVGLVLAAGLLLSPIVQPHHGVVLWPLAAATAAVALDAARPRGTRAAAATVLALVGLGLVAAPAGLGKAVALNAAALLLAAGGMLAGVRPAPSTPGARPRMLPASHESS